MPNVIDLLKERGFIDSVTSDEVRTHLEQPRLVYCGFDPTADSLHLGNLVSIMGLAWFQRCGHTPVAIVGGATGMVGDPSGKSVERNLLDEETITKNLHGIRQNLESILAADVPNRPLILNNYDWFKDYSLLHFLRDIGKHFRLGPMLGKEMVRTRLQSEEGLSFTEFSYQLLQGYDFLHLLDQHKVTIQLGGSDQWGNIIAGTDLIRKMRGEAAYGITFPLITSSDGKKFGKSEQGAVWLSPDKLSPYAFYQFLYRVADADVILLMRMLTFMNMAEIREYERRLHSGTCQPNEVQKRLAQEITRIVHGEEGVKKAEAATQAAAPGAHTLLNAENLLAIASELPCYQVNKQQIIERRLVDLLVELNVLLSKGEARRLIANGGLNLNNHRIPDESFIIGLEDFIDGRLLLIGIGKKKKILVQLQ